MLLYKFWTDAASLDGKSKQLVTVDAAVDHVHAVAGAQVVDAVLVDGAVVAVVHAHADAVDVVRLVAAALDVVADHGAADGAGHGGGGAAAAAADLVTQQRADQAAGDGAGAAGARFGLHDLDRIDGAVAFGVRLVAVGDLLGWLLGAGATAQYDGACDHQSCQGGCVFHVVLLKSVRPA